MNGKVLLVSPDFYHRMQMSINPEGVIVTPESAPLVQAAWSARNEYLFSGPSPVLDIVAERELRAYPRRFMLGLNQYVTRDTYRAAIGLP
jgi:hypothetical protein